MANKSLVERFWSRVDRKSDDECWEWIPAKKNRGYGSVTSGRATFQTHRVAYGLAKGPIPDGMVVMHICDNPPCCNPKHLRVGTQSDNAKDKVAKGRQRYVRPANAGLNGKYLKRLLTDRAEGASSSGGESG